MTVAQIVAEMRAAAAVARQHGVPAADPQLIENWADALADTITAPTLPTFSTLRRGFETPQPHGGQPMTPETAEHAKREPDGGPAFPRPHTWNGLSGAEYLILLGHPGMSLRDYFAGQILASISAECVEGIMDPANRGAPEHVRSLYTRAAYALADTAIAERDRP